MSGLVDQCNLHWSCVGTVVMIIFLTSLLRRFRRIRSLSNKALDRLQDQIVLVTGASSGLGEELARVFYQHGCKVILASRRREELERVKQELLQLHSSFAKTYEPEIVVLDLGTEDQEALKKNAEQIVNIYGRIDILLNNAGISSRAKAIDTKIEVDRQMMFVNYLNQIALTKVVLQSMRHRPPFSSQQQPGHIVSISSVQGRFAIPNRSSYSASKHALQAFYDSLRAELSVCSHPDGRPVEVTVVSPGYIRTNLSLNALTSDGSKYARMDKSTENGLEPSEVARYVIEAVLNQENELVISDWKPKLLIILRAIAPDLYFWIMSKYAKK